MIRATGVLGAQGRETSQVREDQNIERQTVLYRLENQ